MRCVVVNNADSALTTDTCLLCDSRVKRGQVVLFGYVGNSANSSKRRIVQHTGCLQAILREAPTAVDEIEFQNRRSAIVASGDPYLIGVS